MPDPVEQNGDELVPPVPAKQNADELVPPLDITDMKEINRRVPILDGCGCLQPPWTFRYSYETVKAWREKSAEEQAEVREEWLALKDSEKKSHTRMATAKYKELVEPQSKRSVGRPKKQQNKQQDNQQLSVGSFGAAADIARTTFEDLAAAESSNRDDSIAVRSHGATTKARDKDADNVKAGYKKRNICSQPANNKPHQQYDHPERDAERSMMYRFARFNVTSTPESPSANQPRVLLLQCTINYVSESNEDGGKTKLEKVRREKPLIQIMCSTCKDLDAALHALSCGLNKKSDNFDNFERRIILGEELAAIAVSPNEILREMRDSRRRPAPRPTSLLETSSSVPDNLFTETSD